jgi:exodeoxyribonuclease-3
VKIATYNVNGVNGRLPNLLSWLEAAWWRVALRIDHLLLSSPLAKRLTAAGVDREVRGRERASDDAPTWIELADAATGSPRRRQRTIPRR